MRIVVVGTSGAGKTTMAKSLAGKLDLPCIELDRLRWEPNWQALVRFGTPSAGSWPGMPRPPRLFLLAALEFGVTRR
jgi:hypothetical protein